jgi:hypothetical protein
MKKLSGIHARLYLMRFKDSENAIIVSANMSQLIINNIYVFRWRLNV